MAEFINQSGNTEDVRSLLKHAMKRGIPLSRLLGALANEKANYNRKSVIKMIEVAIRKLQKEEGHG